MREDEISGDIYFEGCNVHVRNGEGSTDTPNGKGNLIIGYNEPRDDDLMEVPESAECLEDCRGGSHNLIIGTEHEYTSFGGIVTGQRNRIYSRYSAVVGGLDNAATGGFSTVTGGQYNIASGWTSFISGGYFNAASGDASSISGGDGNAATGTTSTVTGGASNEASGDYSSISGGYGNTASVTLHPSPGEKETQHRVPLRRCWEESQTLLR